MKKRGSKNRPNGSSWFKTQITTTPRKIEEKYKIGDGHVQGGSERKCSLKSVKLVIAWSMQGWSVGLVDGWWKDVFTYCCMQEFSSIGQSLRTGLIADDAGIIGFVYWKKIRLAIMVDARLWACFKQGS
ncbi:unnamed protein product [Vicia faba]|uniref:Uncharacterized protein n=1 Tax=Vicia faba TaxID=3906 RepID=A0AAV1B8K5_VICFA|nr:unnamed protein product [Vicia faba]